MHQPRLRDVRGPLGVDQVRGACSGQRGFALFEQNLVAYSGSEHVVYFLKPS
jgi:hypothetical protein